MTPDPSARPVTPHDTERSRRAELWETWRAHGPYEAAIVARRVGPSATLVFSGELRQREGEKAAADFVQAYKMRSLADAAEDRQARLSFPRNTERHRHR